MRFANVDRWTLLLIVVTLLAGAGLRLYQLESKSLWSDELYTAANALYRDASLGQQIERFRRRTTISDLVDSDTFWTVKATDQSPPLFDFIVKGSVKLFDSIEIGVRLPSVIAGIALLVFLAAQALRAREPTPMRVYLVTLILVAFSAVAIEYAQEGRPYSLGLLWAGILSAVFYQRLQQGLTTAPLPGAAEITVFVLACYTHYNLILFSVPLLAIYGVLALRRRDGRAAFLLALVPLAFLPWAWIAHHTILFTARGGIAWAPRMNLAQSIQRALDAMAGILGGAFVVVAMIAVAVYLVRIGFAKDRSRHWRSVLAIAWLVGAGLTFLLLVAQMSVNASMFHPRYLIFAVPLFCIAAAVALVELAQGSILAVIGGLLLASTQFQAIRADQLAPKEAYREAAEWLLPQIEPGGLVVTTWNQVQYRVYLERGGKKPEYLNLTQVTEAASLCQRIATTNGVAVIAHGTHEYLVRALEASCGHQFKITEQGFHDILAQRWTK